MLYNRDFLRVFFRSFFIQTVWNFERMQQVGFAYLIFPLVKKLFQDDRGTQQEIIQRHLEFFNTHPYLAPLIAGVVMKKEEKGADAEEISRIKSMLSTSLSAIGDKFFWALWRPFISLLGIIIIFFTFFVDNRFVLVGILFFLCCYNLPHFWVKWVGFKQGYELGERVIDRIQEIPLQKITNTIRTIGVILLGIIAGALFSCKSVNERGLSYLIERCWWGHILQFLVIGCLIMIAFIGIRKGRSSLILLALLVLGVFFIVFIKLCGIYW